MTGRPADAVAAAAPPQDSPDLRAGLAARRPRPPGQRQGTFEPGRPSPGRAAAGAAVSVAGVCLGIVVLLWVTSDPSPGTGGELTAPVSSAGEAADTAADGPDPAGPAVEPPEPAGSAVEPPVAVDPPAAVPPAVDPPAVDPPAAVPPPALPAAPVPAAQAPTTVPITVLNNSRVTGLADRAATSFRAGGWAVAATGNFRGRIPVTTVYYDDPALQASAQAFADAFGGVARVRPAFDGLPADGVVVVLTRDFPA